MTGSAIALVLIAALCHASWNLLVRRAPIPELANWFMAFLGGVFALPFAIYYLVTDPPSAIGWVFVFGTIVLHIGYFFTLGRAYKHGDMSVVYPVARGLGLVLIPVFGVLILNESVSTYAALGIAAIFAGVIIVGASSPAGLKIWLHPRSLLANRGVAFAIATGLLIASYSNWDKRGVEYVAPLLYMFTVQLGGSLGILPVLRRSYGVNDFKVEFKRRWKISIAGGALQFTSYGLVLTAFTLAPVSYVGPFRELAIVFGVLLAAFVLKESVGKTRIVGATAIGLGAVAVALAP
ncbi:EamA family transporter [Candidatus Lucifugimonas marina]|uniref:SMR family transporter n=1 Tax=Candidatus Lucifugimonas marina TaxID=3038979 RepID=UPI00279E6CD3|nr:EamA family transporter [SAR202 cluster bacterium JH545]